MDNPLLRRYYFPIMSTQWLQAQIDRLLELRASMSMARLWQKQGKNREARELLSGIYGWFTEGFGTPDLIDAKALIEELQ